MGIILVVFSSYFFSILHNIFQVEKAFALSTSEKLIACACSKGIIHFLTPEALEYAGSISYSLAKKFDEEKNAVSYAEVPEQDFQQSLGLPDAVACQFSALEKLGEPSSLYLF